MKTLKSPDGAITFKRLAAVALLVLTLPHSNAEEERLFSSKTVQYGDKKKTKLNSGQVYKLVEHFQAF